MSCTCEVRVWRRSSSLLVSSQGCRTGIDVALTPTLCSVFLWRFSTLVGMRGNPSGLRYHGSSIERRPTSLATTADRDRSYRPTVCCTPPLGGGCAVRMIDAVYHVGSLRDGGLFHGPMLLLSMPIEPQIRYARLPEMTSYLACNNCR